MMMEMKERRKEVKATTDSIGAEPDNKDSIDMMICSKLTIYVDIFCENTPHDQSHL